jgi:enoyl-CoA hydratase/carnithine racemase
VIDLERAGCVFVLHMRSDENRLNVAFVDAVNAALDDVEGSEGEAALVTTGEGRFYSTGLDLPWLAGAGQGRSPELLSAIHRLFSRLLVFPVATVAAINGHAFAAGAMLALAHDIRVMRADRGYVCLPEIDLGTGLPLTPGMHALLDTRLTRREIHEALITGRRYNAQEALERHFVHASLSEGDLRPTMAAIKGGLFADAVRVLKEPPPDWLPD